MSLIYPIHPLGQIWYHLRAHGVANAITLCTSGSALALLGFFMLFSQQFSNILARAHTQQQFVVFLEPNIQRAAIDESMAFLSEQQGDAFSRIDFVSKDTALAEISGIQGVHTAVKLLQRNPLLDSIVLTPKTTLSEAELRQQYQALETLTPHVHSVHLDEAWAVFASRLFNHVRAFMSAFNVALTICMVMLLFYATHMTLASHKTEIRLKFMLGAYPWQLYAPFVGMGAAIGACAGFIAGMALNITQSVYAAAWQSWSGLQFEPQYDLWVVLLLLGASVGTASSAAASARMLRQPLF